MGLTHRQIASAMRQITEKGRQTPGENVREGDFKITVDDHKGYIPSPFLDNEMAFKTNTALLNRKLGKSVYWSELNIHMIEKHGFYEGRSSGFRSEPEELAKILGLVRSNNFHRFEKQKHKIEKPAWTATAFRSLRTI